MLANNIYSNTPVPPTQWGENISQKIVDTLGVSAWDESNEQTFGYRWKGQDTLTWGNLDEWLIIKWLTQQFFERDASILAKQQIDFAKVLAEIHMAQLESLYDFRNPTEIKGFLVHHRPLIPVLKEAYSVVEEFFGNGVSVALEVVKDPETANMEQLFGYIKVDPFSPEEALGRLGAFDDAWFIKQVDVIGGYLNFNLE
jgi:hypothetical protein